MGRMRLIKHLWFVYGLLEDCTAHYTAYSTDRKLLNGKRWKALVELGGLI